MTYKELKEKLLQLDVSDDAEVYLCTEQSEYTIEDCSYCAENKEITLYTKEGLRAFFESIYNENSGKFDDILKEI